MHQLPASINAPLITERFDTILRFFSRFHCVFVCFSTNFQVNFFCSTGRFCNFMQTRRSLPKGWLLVAQKASAMSTRHDECPILQERDIVQEHQPKPLQNSSEAHPSKLRKLSFSHARGRGKQTQNRILETARPVSTDRGTPEWCKNLPISKLNHAKKVVMADLPFEGVVRPRKIPIHLVGQH